MCVCAGVVRVAGHTKEAERRFLPLPLTRARIQMLRRGFLRASGSLPCVRTHTSYRVSGVSSHRTGHTQTFIRPTVSVGRCFSASADSDVNESSAKDRILNQAIKVCTHMHARTRARTYSVLVVCRCLLSNGVCTEY